MPRRPPVSSDGDDEPTEIGAPLHAREDSSEEATQPAGIPLKEALERTRAAHREKKAKAAAQRPRTSTAAEAPAAKVGDVRRASPAVAKGTRASRVRPASSADPRDAPTSGREARRPSDSSAVDAGAGSPARRSRTKLDAEVDLSPPEEWPTEESAPPAQEPSGARSHPRPSALAPEQLLSALERAVQGAQVQKLSSEKLRTAFKAESLPLVRRALERAAGDGVDAYLSRLVAPPGPQAKSAFLDELATHMDKVNRAKDRAVLVAEAKRLVGCVRRHILHTRARPMSLKVLEQEFEGRLDVDTLLGILFAADPELTRRSEEVERLLTKLREQLRGFAGSFPESLFRTFSRLKVEKRVLDAETHRRSPRRPSGRQ